MKESIDETSVYVVIREEDVVNVWVEVFSTREAADEHALKIIHAAWLAYGMDKNVGPMPTSLEEAFEEFAANSAHCSVRLIECTIHNSVAAVNPVFYG